MSGGDRVWAETNVYRVVPRLRGIPEWEKAKGNCRNLLPQDAVNECAWLSDQYRRSHRSMLPVQPEFRRIVGLTSA